MVASTLTSWKTAYPIKTVSCLLTIIFICSNALSLAQAAEFNTRVDRSELTNDEHLVLTLSLFNSDTRLRAQGVNPNIDLTVLTDNFDLGTPRNKTNYNVFRNRGRATSSLEVDLFPKAPGNFVIPSFTVDNLSSQPIKIKVLPSKHGDAPLAFSRGGVNKTSVWQRQQLIVYVDTYYRVELDSAKLGGSIELEPTPLEVYEHYRLPIAERTEHHEGFTYQVKRASWAVFPLDSGPLTVHLPDTWIVTADQQQLRLPHESFTVNIKPLPTGIGADTLVGKPELTIETIQSSDKVGDLSSWRIRISAPVTFNSLPATLNFSSIDNLNLFIDNKSDDRQDSSTGIQQIAYYTLSGVAQAQGQYQLPSIELHYFDTEQGMIKTATLNGPQFLINEEKSTVTTETPAQPTTLPVFEEAPPYNILWIISTVLFAMLWLITLGYFIRKQRRAVNAKNTDNTASKTSSKKINSDRPLEAQLLNAFECRSLEQALAAWRQRHGDHQHITDTVRCVQSLYYSHNSQLDIKTLQQDVDTCCEIIISHPPLYSDNPDPWMPIAFTKSLR